MCKLAFTEAVCKVADHCHLSGRLRHTLCAPCNLKLVTPKFVPCFLHNLSKYDAHFIVTELGYDKESITVIPNTENYISFSKRVTSDFSVRFLDSYRFMASSLAELAGNLLTKPGDFDKFRETAKEFQPADMPLVTRKGVFPYEYSDKWSRLGRPSCHRNVSSTAC
uniref:DNA-directed DNA polymerase n=1 Tax=Sipha flava TaxID=143950 RepID=A0A2S2QMF9_9HEMI